MCIIFIHTIHLQCNMGGIVPNTYYLCNQKTNSIENSTTNDGKCRCVVIPPRTKELLEFHANESGLNLRYFFL